MVRKHISNKELRDKMKEDPFVEFVKNAREYLLKYNQQIIAGIVVFLIVGLVSWVFVKHRKTVNDDSMLMLSRVEQAYDANKTEEGDKLLEELLNNYSSSAAAPYALLLKAQRSYNSGKYDDALNTYQRCENKYSGDVNFIAQKGIAYVKLAKGDGQGALKIFQELIENCATTSEKAEMYYMIALCQEELGQFEDAAKNYMLVSEKSAYRTMAKQRAELLRDSAKPPADKTKDG